MSYRKSSLVTIVIYALFAAFSQMIQQQNWSLNVVYYTLFAFYLLAAGTMLWLHFKTTPDDLYTTQNQTFQLKFIWWGVLAGVLLFILQFPISWLESLVFHTNSVSLNTLTLIAIIKKIPLYAVAIVILAPLMEEILFRKILFGVLFPLIKPIGAGIISSLLFAFIHNDGHWLLYCIMGFVFAALYYYSKNIFTSYIAHVTLNLAVLIFQLI